MFRLTSFIQHGFQQHSHTVATILDFEQAIDKVWHNGLIYKLHQLNFPDIYIHLLADYLQNRTFQVRIGAALSTSRNIEAGVPQGSVLAPVLYSIYVQDMPTMPDCLHSLYADDTVIFTRHFNIHAACVNMQNALNILTQWSTKWRLKVNGEKSQLMVFTKRFPRIIDQLSIQNQIIPFTTSVKYLGVLLDKRLSYRHHIQNIRDKAFQRYMALYPLFKSLTSRKAKVLLYTSVIRSYIHYCCEIWGQAHPRHLKSLEGIQRAVCRTITGAHYLTNNVKLYSELHIPFLVAHIQDLQTTYRNKLLHHANPLLRDIT